MARYIDADKLIDKIFHIGLIDDGKYAINAKAIKMAIDSCPTAHVAPRAEVAVEVIGEVEKMARDYIDGIMLLDPQNTYCFGGINAFENVIKFLAELKKKYTA